MRRGVRLSAVLSVVPLVMSLALVACGPSGGASPSGGATPAPAVSSAGESPAGDAATVGKAFVEALAVGDFAGAAAMEDPTMSAAAPAAALGQLWAQFVGQFGAFGGIGDVTTADSDPYVNAAVETRFANATVPLLVTVTRDGQVAGLHLGEPGPAVSGGPASASPASPASAAPSEGASPAAYVDPSRFTETEVTVGSDPWALPGTLAMPVGAGPFPAVVLIAGSGPNDRDETIGPNKPLRDLAWGLASNGIAVLRYDKRTKTHGTEMAARAGITVKEEVIDDAVAAVDLLRETPGIDPDRIFVAGHSLGGHLAPRIAASAPGRVAGIAVLEGSISPLQRLVEHQLTYLASDAGGADSQAKAMLEALPAQVARAESADLSPDTPASELPLGIPASYWLDLRGYEPGTVARGLGIPILLAQGGRDYQVPPSELSLWREALAGSADVTIREYPAINHLLMAGEGQPRPAEYAVPAHVAAEVVADLASWVEGSVP